MNEQATQIAKHIQNAVKETIENEVMSLSMKDLYNLISEYLTLQTKYKLSNEAEMLLNIASDELMYREARLHRKNLVSSK